MTQTTFTQQNLRHQNWDGHYFNQIDFTGSDLSGSNLSEGLFIGCLFCDTQMHDVCLVDSVLVACDFRGAHIATEDTRGARFIGCQFDPDVVTFDRQE
jgi:uncharacterized protein YjbI with pentapeptide repeats